MGPDRGGCGAMRFWRAYHDGLMSPGAAVCLNPDESHHMTKVLRLEPGVEVRLFDGRGGEWAGVVESADTTGVLVRIGVPARDKVEPSTRLTLLQSTCRADRLEWVLQKGTEIGVSEFRLVQTAASERLRPTPAKRKRWKRIILEACKQSGRRVLPGLYGPENLAELAAAVHRPAGPALVLHPAGNTCSVAAACGMTGGDPVRLLVGPESGFDDPEIDLLLGSGWQPVGLGPRTLRTETAGLVAAALILSHRGELNP